MSTPRKRKLIRFDTKPAADIPPELRGLSFDVLSVSDFLAAFDKKVERTHEVQVDDAKYTFKKYENDPTWYLYDAQGNEYASSRTFEFSPDVLRDQAEHFHWGGPGKERGAEPVEVFAPDMLTLEEGTNLSRAILLVSKIRKFPQPIVCTFRAGKCFHGLFKSDTCGVPGCMNCNGLGLTEIYLSRHILTDFSQTLKVLVHEVAHFKGVDGSNRHLLELQDMWAELTVSLL